MSKIKIFQSTMHFKRFMDSLVLMDSIDFIDFIMYFWADFE